MPRGELLAVIGEAVPDEVADPAEGQPLVRRLQYGHRDEGDVRVGRLHDPAVLALAVDVLLVRGLVAVRDSVVFAIARKHILHGVLQLAVRGVASRVNLGLWWDLIEVRRRRRRLRREHGWHLRYGGRWAELWRRRRRQRWRMDTRGNDNGRRWREWRQRRRQHISRRKTLLSAGCRRRLSCHRRELSLVGGSCRQRRGLLHRPLVPLEREDALDAERAVVHHAGRALDREWEREKRGHATRIYA